MTCHLRQVRMYIDTPGGLGWIHNIFCILTIYLFCDLCYVTVTYCLRCCCNVNVMLRLCYALNTFSTWCLGCIHNVNDAYTTWHVVYIRVILYVHEIQDWPTSLYRRKPAGQGGWWEMPVLSQKIYEYNN